MSKPIWLALALLLMGAWAAAVASKAQPSTEGFNCKIVQCPAPQCEYGEHLEVPPGACCPVCVPD